jgi:hypothetical protein
MLADEKGIIALFVIQLQYRLTLVVKRFDATTQ